MDDNGKTKDQLIQEGEDLRRKIAELGKSETERKRVEEALRESAERYRGLFEHISSCVAIYEAWMMEQISSSKISTLLESARRISPEIK